MSRLMDIATEFGYFKTATLENPAEWLQATGRAERFSIPHGEMYHEQARLYQCLSWIHIAVKVVSQSAAVVPLGINKKAEKETVEAIDNHPFEML